MQLSRSSLLSALWIAAAWPGLAAAQGDTIVYRCPGNVYTSSQELNPKQAQEKGCRAIENAPVTVVQGVRPRAGSPVPAAGTARPADAKVDPAAQRARDGDARRILEAELKKEEEQLAQMLKEYNNGEPERLGDERNYQKYLDRVAEMKAALARKENDVAAIRRELAKLPAP